MLRIENINNRNQKQNATNERERRVEREPRKRVDLSNPERPMAAARLTVFMSECVLLWRTAIADDGPRRLGVVSVKIDRTIELTTDPRDRRLYTVKRDDAFEASYGQIARGERAKEVFPYPGRRGPPIGTPTRSDPVSSLRVINTTIIIIIGFLRPFFTARRGRHAED